MVQGNDNSFFSETPKEHVAHADSQAFQHELESLRTRDLPAPVEHNPAELRLTNIDTAKSLLREDEQMSPEKFKLTQNFLKFAFSEGGFTNTDRAPVADLLQKAAMNQENPAAQTGLMKMAEAIRPRTA